MQEEQPGPERVRLKRQLAALQREQRLPQQELEQGRPADALRPLEQVRATQLPGWRRPGTVRQRVGLPRQVQLPGPPKQAASQQQVRPEDAMQLQASAEGRRQSRLVAVQRTAEPRQQVQDAAAARCGAEPASLQQQEQRAAQEQALPGEAAQQQARGQQKQPDAQQPEAQRQQTRRAATAQRALSPVDAGFREWLWLHRLASKRATSQSSAFRVPAGLERWICRGP